MAPLHIVILDHDYLQRQRLIKLLSALCLNCSLVSRDAAHVLPQCLVTSVDLVMCHLSGEIDPVKDLLRKLSGLSNPPAVAFYGCDSKVGYLETNCLNFELPYLGFFSTPFDEKRLRRMLDQLQMLGQRPL